MDKDFGFYIPSLYYIIHIENQQSTINAFLVIIDWFGYYLYQVYNKSTIYQVYNKSTIYQVYNKSTIYQVYNKSTIYQVYNKSTIYQVYITRVQEYYISGI